MSEESPAIDGRLSEAQGGDRRGTDRRSRRAGFRLRERRTGFDRRLPADPTTPSARYRLMLRSLRDQSPRLLLVLIAINLLNLADFVLTLDALDRGAAEANPVMRVLLDTSDWAGGVFKMGVIFAVSLAVWRFRRFRTVLEVGLLALGIFSLVFVYQLAGRLFL